MGKTGLPRDGFGFVERLSEESRLSFEQRRELAFDQGADFGNGFEIIAVQVRRFRLHPIQYSRSEGFHDAT